MPVLLSVTWLHGNVIYDASPDLLCVGDSTAVMEMYSSLLQEAIKEMGGCFSEVTDLIC